MNEVATADEFRFGQLNAAFHLAYSPQCLIRFLISSSLSTFKRFVGEEGFKVYVEKKTKRTIVTVEHYSLLAQTGVGACKGLTVSNS